MRQPGQPRPFAPSRGVTLTPVAPAPWVWMATGVAGSIAAWAFLPPAFAAAGSAAAVVTWAGCLDRRSLAGRGRPARNSDAKADGSARQDFDGDFARLAGIAGGRGAAAGIAVVEVDPEGTTAELEAVERALQRVARTGESVLRLDPHRLALTLVSCQDPDVEQSRIERAVANRMPWPGLMARPPATTVLTLNGQSSPEAREFAEHLGHGGSPELARAPALRAVDPRSIRRQLVAVPEARRLRRAG